MFCSGNLGMRLGFFITASVRVRDRLRTSACKRYFILWISAVTIQQIGILHIAHKMLVHCCIAIQMWLLLTLGAHAPEAYVVVLCVRLCVCLSEKLVCQLVLVNVQLKALVVQAGCIHQFKTGVFPKILH